MGTRPSAIQLLLQQRNARKRGPTSSDQWNDTIDELSHDSAELNTQWNNRLVPLTSTIPNGSDTTSVDAFTNGLDGSNLYLDSDAAASSSYYNSTSNRPNTVLEQFADVYTQLTDLETDLLNQITNNSVTASQVAVVDTGNLYDANNVEACLAEVMIEVNGLALTNYKLGDLIDVDTTGAVANNFLRYDGSEWTPATVTGVVEIANTGAAGRLAIWNNATSIYSTSDLVWDGDQLVVGDGTAAIPILAFNSDKDMGLFRSGPNELGFTTSGVNKWVLGNEGNFSAQQAGIALEVDNLTVGNVATGVVSIDAHVSQNIQGEKAPFGTSTTIDWDNGNLATIDLGSASGDVTVTLNNPAEGSFYLIKVTQDDTTPRDLVWPASVLWEDGVTPVISTGANAVDVVALYYDGTNYLGKIGQNYS